MMYRHTKFLKKLSILILVMVLSIFTLRSSPLLASNIDSTHKWAWNDIVGWIDFYVSNTGVEVESSELIRWGIINSSTNAYIAVNCDSLPPGATNDCTPSFSVTNNISNGDLGGYAWSDEFGWIKFSGTSPAYGVDIDALGEFHGYAWNDIIGWISFNCDNHSGCGTSNYYVETSWGYNETSTPDNYLESATFDTGSTDGFAINSIYWEGSKSANAQVGFQIAVSSSTTFVSDDFLGPNGSISDIYETVPGDTGAGKAIIVNGASHHPFESGYRYFRYRVYVDTSDTNPVISEVNVNWAK